MNLLGAILYDPAAAVSKGAAASVMAVFDATNLALAITVPAHGKVRIRMVCALSGATTFSQYLLGVLNHTGGAVLGRINPVVSLGGTALATNYCSVEADFIMTGLTPGALTLDAAWGCELFVAASLLRYGGPNNTVASDAWGAFCFEAWDPIPLPTAAPGAANGLQICGANAATTYATLTSTGAFTVQGTATVSQSGDSYGVVKSGASGDNAAIKAKTDLIPAAPASTTNITAGTIATVTTLTNPVTLANGAHGGAAATLTLGGAGGMTATHTGNTTGSVGSVTGAVGSVTGAVGSVTAGVTVTTNSDKTGYGLSAAAVQAVWDALTSALTTVGSIGKKLADWTIGTAQTGDSFVRIGAAGAGLTALGDARIVNLDATVGSRSTFAGGAVASVTGNVGGNVVGSVASVIAAVSLTGDLTATMKTSVTTAATAATPTAAAVTGAVGSVTANVNADVKKVNAVTITGVGTSGSPWGPA